MQNLCRNQAEMCRSDYADVKACMHGLYCYRIMGIYAAFHEQLTGFVRCLKRVHEFTLIIANHSKNSRQVAA